MRPVDSITPDLDPQVFFSDSYRQARDRFCTVAECLGAGLDRYPIQDDEELTIDVAIIPAASADPSKIVVVSSGVHGVEGPLGSAVQLAWLEEIRARNCPRDVGYVLIHAVNPFGFAHHRRWNEDNVDLNRNFLDAAEDYAGAPPGYAKIQTLLNPTTVPSRWEPFRLRAFCNILRFGLPAIKQAIASGQYEFPRGLFFGGSRPAASTRCFHESFASWVGDATHVVHLDLHTGLGRFADGQLLVESDADSAEIRWFNDVFGEAMVQSTTAKGTAYQARGTLLGWAARQMSERNFRAATVEFGTYGLVRVLAALRAENRVHHHAKDPSQFAWVEAELRECFCPASPRWRSDVVHKSIEMIAAASRAI